MIPDSENQRIEFKETWKDEFLEWICGFANANGGAIYIGVDDKGRAVGLKNAKRLLEDIPNKNSCNIRDSLRHSASAGKRRGLSCHRSQAQPGSCFLPWSISLSFWRNLPTADGNGLAQFSGKEDEILLG